jgi:hypothetical protein
MLNFTSQDTSKQLLSGEGWRIGFRSDVDLYKGLVGADSWAIELTETEFKDFCKLATQLSETMQKRFLVRSKLRILPLKLTAILMRLHCTYSY